MSSNEYTGFSINVNPIYIGIGIIEICDPWLLEGEVRWRIRGSIRCGLTSKLTCSQVSGAAVANANVEVAARAVTDKTRAASAAHC